MRILLCLFSILVGCGDSQRDLIDASPAGDGGTLDAAGPGPTTTCKLNKRITMQPSGSRSEFWTYFVPVQNASPGDGLSVVLCDLVSVSTATCATGATCTESGDPLPIGRVCAEAVLTFYGSVALAICGTEVHNFDANGAPTAGAGSHYMTAEIRR